MIKLERLKVLKKIGGEVTKIINLLDGIRKLKAQRKQATQINNCEVFLANKEVVNEEVRKAEEPTGIVTHEKLRDIRLCKLRVSVYLSLAMKHVKEFDKKLFSEIAKHERRVEENYKGCIEGGMSIGTYEQAWENLNNSYAKAVSFTRVLFKKKAQG